MLLRQHNLRTSRGALAYGNLCDGIKESTSELWFLVVSLKWDLLNRKKRFDRLWDLLDKKQRYDRCSVLLDKKQIPDRFARLVKAVVDEKSARLSRSSALYEIAEDLEDLLLF